MGLDVSWVTPVVLSVTGVCMVAMIAITMRWTIRLGTHEARVAQAVADASTAAAFAQTAMDKAEEARVLAMKRADSIAAQYGKRVRKQKERELAEDEPEHAQPRPANTQAEQEAEVAEWHRRRGFGGG